MNIKKGLIFLALVYVFSAVCAGQKSWHGEIALSGGGGTNDIFRFNELEGAGSFTGTGIWSTAMEVRRLMGNHFSMESGLSYSHQYYYHSPAPGIPGDDIPGSFGLVSLPFTARIDILRILFADAGVVAAFQTGSSAADNMSGLGLTLGAGIQYTFKSDIFIRVRTYACQYTLLPFLPDNYQQRLWNSGVSAGFGYRFIHLGRCNCPEQNMPRRRFY